MEQGLTQNQVIEQQKIFGKNEISITQSFSTLKLFISQFPTIINGILAVGAVFSFLIKEPLDGFFIIAILILNALFGFFQEYRAEKTLQKLKTIYQPICVVLRDGKTTQLKTSDLVPGDIVILSEGDRIPADGVIFTESHVEIDESILTGESLPVIKNKEDEVLQGTFIAKGKTRIKVTKTGSETQLGQISLTLSSVEEEETPLQKQISSLARILSFGAIGISALILPVGIFYGRALYPILLLAISIGVAAIPESLPAVITIALAIGTNRMAQKKAIVRKLSSIETIGAVEIVLTDKTGTLTQNDMTVKEYYIAESAKLHELAHACIVGNTAHVARENDKDIIIGDKTDGAILMWAKNQQINIDHDVQLVKILDEYTFDPISKIITTVAELHEKPFVIVRGAPESVLLACKLDKISIMELEKKYEEYAAQGLRVIAVAEKHEPNHKKFSRKDLEKNMEFLGFMCLYDPPRKEAARSIIEAQTAGIRVIMVTGDNPLTAKAIAKEVGILDGNKSVITGNELDNMSDEELKQTVKLVDVYARTTPEHKMRLVTTFQSLGFVVGVTGDGVNDALALKKANVGLSMGQKGTDVAKEASDIILSDDNFATIIQAVKEGRTIYANIVNAITYLLAGNLAELGLIFFATFFNMAIPLVPTQILWINLVTDGMPALALASEKSSFRQLFGKPRKKEEPIITKKRLLFILISSSVITLFLLFIFALLNQNIDIDKARTVIFNLMIFLQLILVFVVRGKQSLFSNKYLIITIVLTIIFQIFLTFNPVLQEIFHLSI